MGRIYISSEAREELKEYLREYLAESLKAQKDEDKGGPASHGAEAGVCGAGFRSPLPCANGPEDLGLIQVPPSALTYPAAASHPDLYHCPINGRMVSGEPAGYSYPHNVGFCGVQLGQYFVHNLKYTAPALMQAVREAGLSLINVKQGYTKCSLVVVEAALPINGAAGARDASGANGAAGASGAALPINGAAGARDASGANGAAGASGAALTVGNSCVRPAVITSDRGIEKALAPYPIDVLLIRPGHVVLPGFPLGFLGGASGLVGRRVVFHGDLLAHPDFLRIRRFIEERNKEAAWFSGFPLTDIGSIVTLP